MRSWLTNISIFRGRKATIGTLGSAKAKLQKLDFSWAGRNAVPCCIGSDQAVRNRKYSDNEQKLLSLLWRLYDGLYEGHLSFAYTIMILLSLKERLFVWKLFLGINFYFNRFLCNKILCFFQKIKMRSHKQIILYIYLAKLQSVKKVVSNSCAIIKGPSIRINGILKKKILMKIYRNIDWKIRKLNKKKSFYLPWKSNAAFV